VGISLRYRALTLLAVGATAVCGCGAPTASTSSSDDGFSYSAPPIPGHALSGRFGSSGTSLWLLSQSILSLSDDGGLHWTSKPLPDNVTAAAVADVAQIPNRRLWIAVPDSSGIHLYTMAAGSSTWTSSLLVPTWPSGAESAGPAGTVAISPGPASLVTVAASIPNGSDGEYSSLFTSTDDGLTFVEHPATANSPANVVWKHVAFVDAKSGLIVGGTSETTLLHSSDGGTTWAAVSPKALPASGSYYLGNPTVTGSDIVVPVISLPTNGSGASLSLLMSHDGGLTFDGSAGAALDLGSAVNPVVASRGADTWVVPSAGGHVFVTGDGGRTWTDVIAAGLPSGVSMVALTGQSSATALIGVAGCAGFVANCWTGAYVVATSDGGRTWNAV
jgi:photosystem II stability/assembly factor-like uncharacterized protein